MSKPFNPEDIEDVRIIIKAKGEHYSIVPNEDINTRDQARTLRISVLRLLIPGHDIVDTPLEQAEPKLKQKLGIEGKIEPASGDKERLDFLQQLTDNAEYTGKVVLRYSSTGRGWRLHETIKGGFEDVREAIDEFARQMEENEI